MSETRRGAVDARQEKVEKHIHRALKQRVPSAKCVGRWVKPLSKAFDPVFLGLDNIPSDRNLKLMFVGNHTMLALDLPLLVHGLLQLKGLFIRTMGDFAHFNLPLWRSILYKSGVVPGSREVCRALIQDRQPVLIYPGGAREAFKKKADAKYSLFWNDHKGFARLAIQEECVIIPVTVLGMEDIIDVLCDMPLGKLISERCLSLPVMKPPGPGRYQRIYYFFGQPIPTSSFNRRDCEANVVQLRDQCQDAILAGLRFLRAIQRTDPNRFAYKRMFGKLLPPRSTSRRIESPDEERSTDAHSETFIPGEAKDDAKESPKEVPYDEAQHSMVCPYARAPFPTLPSHPQSC